MVSYIVSPNSFCSSISFVGPYQCRPLDDGVNWLLVVVRISLEHAASFHRYGSSYVIDDNAILSHRPLFSPKLGMPCLFLLYCQCSMINSYSNDVLPLTPPADSPPFASSTFGCLFHALAPFSSLKLFRHTPSPPPVIVSSGRYCIFNLLWFGRLPGLSRWINCCHGLFYITQTSSSISSSSISSEHKRPLDNLNTLTIGLRCSQRDWSCTPSSFRLTAISHVGTC